MDQNTNANLMIKRATLLERYTVSSNSSGVHRASTEPAPPESTHEDDRSSASTGCPSARNSTSSLGPR